MNTTIKHLHLLLLIMGLLSIIGSSGVFISSPMVQSAEAKAEQRAVAAPPAISGDNVYVAWWTNKTANNLEEVMFRASTDNGATFGEKINLSNTTNADSNKVEIDSDADSVVVTWWESNQTAETPVMRVSSDNGATFGPILMLATNGTIGEAAEED